MHVTELHESLEKGATVSGESCSSQGYSDHMRSSDCHLCVRQQQEAVTER